MQQIRLIDELRGALGCEGVVLEAAFCDDAEPQALVWVYRVSLPGTRPLAEPGQVVKFSQIDHALPRAKFVQIASQRHGLRSSRHRGDSRVIQGLAPSPLLGPRVPGVLAFDNDSALVVL